MSHDSSSSPAGGAPSGAERARWFTVQQRREAMEAFFTCWPGDDRHRLGLGRALDDFQSWQIRSGRLVDSAGSPWWSTVNGFLVGDLVDARTGAEGPWQDYASSAPTERQSRLWLAHQHSINRGVDAAEGLLAGETETERAFIELALGVVEMAAATGSHTSSGSLGRRTGELYPGGYPCRESDLERLRREMEL